MVMVKFIATNPNKTSMAKLFNNSKIKQQFDASSIILAGLTAAAVGYAGRYVLRSSPNLSKKISESLKLFQSVDTAKFANSKYYKGGFEEKMSKREASLILGISPTATKLRVKEAHKRVMSLNHPDRGGSPYIAAKINEAKDLLEGNR